MSSGDTVSLGNNGRVLEMGGKTLLCIFHYNRKKEQKPCDSSPLETRTLDNPTGSLALPAGEDGGFQHHPARPHCPAGARRRASCAGTKAHGQSPGPPAAETPDAGDGLWP